MAKEDSCNLELKGAGEVIKIREGSISSARNLGAARSKFDELLFLDADMVLPDTLDLSTLSSFGFDIATAEYRVSELSDYLLQSWQNFWAEAGCPLAMFGGFIYVRKDVFNEIGGFRDCVGEDIEFAWRAWHLGYRIEKFPFRVLHSRPFHWKSLVGVLPKLPQIWGVPSIP
jgi:glycosyltransferase involved in cell wall biosynthesis